MNFSSSSSQLKARSKRNVRDDVAVSPLSRPLSPSDASPFTLSASMPIPGTPSTTRKVSWHSSADTSPSVSRANSRGCRADVQGLTRREPLQEVNSDTDEADPILERSRGSGRSYGTQQDGARTETEDHIPGSPEEDIDESEGHPDYRRPSAVKKPSAANVRNNDRDQDEGDTRSWWKKTIERYGSVELENRGSVARDHLALERTFLAWLRTSLSFASIGIAVTQLFRLNTNLDNDQAISPQRRLRHVGKPLGATFLAIGIVTLILGFHRYFESQHYVIRGKFPASRGSIILLSAITTALIIASFVIVLTIAPKALAKA